jgi:U4/U6.U5 tri-snRNP-associated protein 1
MVKQRLDEFGRPMTTKEAWRHLNHNFHGKRPGEFDQRFDQRFDQGLTGG